MSDLTPEALDELERLLAEATGLPWYSSGTCIRGASSYRDANGAPMPGPSPVTGDVGSEDRALIVAAVNALPALIAAARREQVRHTALNRWGCGKHENADRFVHGACPYCFDDLVLAEKERDRLREEITGLIECAGHLESQKGLLTKERDRLREALAEYGGHEEDCAIGLTRSVEQIERDERALCTCGWDVVAKELLANEAR